MTDIREQSLHDTARAIHDSQHGKGDYDSLHPFSRQRMAAEKMATEGISAFLQSLPFLMTAYKNVQSGHQSSMAAAIQSAQGEE